MSFKAALIDPAAATGKQTQFYSMLGTRGIWHQGWFAGTVHAAAPSGWGHFDADRWELYHLESDRSQVRDLAAEHPEKLAELQTLWSAEAHKYQALPLSDLNVLEMMARHRPTLAGERDRYVYYPGTAEVPLGACVQLRGRSFALLARVHVERRDAAGVLIKQGARHGGHVLFLRDGHLHYVYNFLGEREQWLSAPQPVGVGEHILGVRYERSGTVPATPPGSGRRRCTSTTPRWRPCRR